MKRFLLLTLLLLVFAPAFGQSCVGKWVTIDDKTGKKKSVVELYKKDGKLFGKIIYLFPREGREPDPKCTKCSDDRKDQPLVGLQIVRDLSWNGSAWKKGTIVDPENGKVYGLEMWLKNDNPDILSVKGKVGPFSRTQSWLRVPKE